MAMTNFGTTWTAWTAGTGTGITGIPAYASSSHEERLEYLEQEIKKRSHIEIAKDQEERIVKLESALTEVIEKNMQLKDIVEEQKLLIMSSKVNFGVLS